MEAYDSIVSKHICICLPISMGFIFISAVDRHLKLHLSHQEHPRPALAAIAAPGIDAPSHITPSPRETPLPG